MTCSISDVNVIEYSNKYPNYPVLTRNMEKLFGRYSVEIQVVDKALLELVFNNRIAVEEIEKLRGQKKQILVDVINEMINWFPQFRQYPVMVYLFGSYGRNSNRLYSDIDLNFYYPDKYFKEMLPVEEFFCICLYRLFELDGRERVHSMGCLPLVRDIKYKKTPKFSLLFRNGYVINYEHKRFSLCVMNEIFNMSRELDSIIAYLNSNDNSARIIEWNASIDLIYNNSEFLFDNILNASDCISEQPEFKQRLKKITEVMLRDFSQKRLVEMSCIDDITIADFKKTYKTTPFNDIYSILAVLRLILLSENYNLGYLQIDKYFKNGIIRHILGEQNLERLIDSYYHYYIFMTKTEYIFRANDVVLSSQIMNKVNQHFYNQYKELFKVQFNTDALISLKNVYQSLYLISKCLVEYLS
jgi:predicted nucleotidyltransferase